ncbi:hypothetical protein, partial [uncultured Croceitalea sp.]|uniref:hypothetical protein n=1 Tax=uncultured Croceitalea sp. TaxID=1798908 RepID=UPI00374E6EA6
LLGDVTLEIAAGAVGTTELADDAVTPLKIDAAIAGTGLARSAAGVLSVDGSAITGDGDITSSDLTVGGDADALLGDVTLEIAAGAVGTTELADDAVTSAKIADGTIASGDIADDAVTPLKINAAIAGTGLARSAAGVLSVDGSAITGDGDITSSDLTVGGDADALLGDITLEIAAGAVGTIELADDAVTSAKIADDAVTAAKINIDVAGTGLSQNVTTGALEVDATGSEIELDTPIDVDGDGTDETNVQDAIADLAALPRTYSMGKVNGDATAASIYNATVARVTADTEGDYQITFTNALANTNYIIQLTILDCGGNCPPSGGSNYDDPGISYYDQQTTGFKVNIGDSDNGTTAKDDIDLEFMFTVTVLPN